MPFPRTSGILLHPTSLPGRFGIGDIGPEAFRFIEFLADSGQRLWQVLPLGPAAYGNSPYMCYSAMAGNPLLISLEWLQGDGWLPADAFDGVPDLPPEFVDYEAAIAIKLPILRQACANFHTNANAEQRDAYDAFCDRAAPWLDDYALFMALKSAHDNEQWFRWPAEYARREPGAIARARTELHEEITFHRYLQFEFFQQWSKLKAYANEKEIQIIGDIPIYVAQDSAEVWGNPEIFCLDEQTLEPAWMSGVPPDYFSATGQLWGNPVYRWDYLAETGYKWWFQRFYALLDQVDLIRIDHFRAFAAYWAVPHGETTALNGDWVEGPGAAFFEALDHELGTLPIVAEDLGIITPDVEALRDQFAFPGMKILHFAFDSGPRNPYLPYNYEHPNCMVYTGTHDNNTTVGWFQARSPEEQDRVLNYLGYPDPSEIHWHLMRLASSSSANQAIFPLQDVLGLDGRSRMNTPSEASGNWQWRYVPGVCSPELAERLAALTATYGRIPDPPENPYPEGEG